MIVEQTHFVPFACLELEAQTPLTIFLIWLNAPNAASPITCVASPKTLRSERQHVADLCLLANLWMEGVSVQH